VAVAVVWKAGVNLELSSTALKSRSGAVQALSSYRLTASELVCFSFTNRAGHGSISVSLFVNLLEVDSLFFFVMASLGQDDTLVLLVYAIYTSYIITQFTYIYIYTCQCVHINAVLR